MYQKLSLGTYRGFFTNLLTLAVTLFVRLWVTDQRVPSTKKLLVRALKQVLFTPVVPYHDPVV